ncbi:PREDICTED: glucocorticoid-induced transcript 1 protein-like isoform X1 [Papilio xuthus]|uniref:Glucocorticoid-induced transcript 1 protein-like isoform X1 n=1 Tax=Papilio xuthus TaxID=66420 RepID=A0AAJ6Z4I5_PAPXU|nr:PREDICTED: glucocorticoid-induced transcript 1 protein-like isoform X1 [Papilio xuthus]
MSGRVRKQSDCPVSKQGPMRATLPVSSVMKQSGGFKKNSGNSPTLSPTNVWRRISPDHALSGQRSPGAVNYKGKGRFGASVIRRTASLDTLYHKGQWSRDYYLHAGQLQVDKSTQTDEGGGASGRSSRGSEDDKLDRFLRSRLQRPHKASASGDFSGNTMSPGFWSRFGTGGVPLRAARSSVEGLNQEIERIVLCPASGTQTPHLDRLRDKVTPEGHRAPLAELLRRSVNTQTPHDLCHTAHSSDPPSRGSLSSAGSAELLAAGGSVCSSPDLDGSKLGTSPQINRFLAREPPDGCEKVNLKAGEGAYTEAMMMKPSVAGFTLRPSLGSAFQPLQPAPTTPSPPPAASSASSASPTH